MQPICSCQAMESISEFSNLQGHHYSIQCFENVEQLVLNYTVSHIPVTDIQV